MIVVARNSVSGYIYYYIFLLLLPAHLIQSTRNLSQTEQSHARRLTAW
ncbi:MAG: hypothetical protein HW406_2366 [Candidatus Brocadiaceae bacterium]|nr:hypothetical protein [Candidatus Brocadiaceae bacterium]